MDAILTWLLTDWVWLEFVGGGMTIACVYALAVNKALAGWVLGIMSAAMYIVLFWNSAIFAETAINLFYLGSCVWGLILWKGWGDKIRSTLRLPEKDSKPVPITDLNAKGWLLTIGSVAILTALGTWVLGFTITDVAFLDSLTTSLAIVAQFLLAKKVFANWHLWITADVVYVILFVYKGLFITAGVYAILLATCVKALFEWRNIRRAETVAAGPQALQVAEAV